MSVDGDNGLRGTLVHLPYASPETITEGTPSAQATVTLTQSLGCGNLKARPPRLGRDSDRAQGQVLAQKQTISAVHT